MSSGAKKKLCSYGECTNTNQAFLEGRRSVPQAAISNAIHINFGTTFNYILVSKYCLSSDNVSTHREGVLSIELGTGIVNPMLLLNLKALALVTQAIHILYHT